jgi:hypothetical protein
MKQILTVPFFSWRLRNSKGPRNSAEIEKSLIEILSDLNESLSTGRKGRFYNISFKCSMADLIKRHELNKERMQKPSPRASVTSSGKELEKEQQSNDQGQQVSCLNPDLRRDEEERPHEKDPTYVLPAKILHEKVASSDNEKGENEKQRNYAPPLRTRELLPTYTEKSTGPPLPDPSRPTEPMPYAPIESVERNFVMMRRLFEVSQEILWAFTPKEGSHLIHNVCVTFWGFLDTIFRVSVILSVSNVIY